MMMPAVRWLPRFGSTVNFGSSSSATFIRKVALSHFQPMHARSTSAIDRARGDQPVEQQLGIDPGDDASAPATPCRRRRRPPRGPCRRSLPRPAC